ncbi:MAG: 5-formyltetrahydrofolate cyclo-ligase [Proteobacteria bacterium]|nr:5-formyltetrahydrofolate cyclo-ligase [Pseudomonadota bacterium]
MKAQIRQSALKARRAMSAESRNFASAKICSKLVRSHEFFAAKSIACYLPMPDEVDPCRIIERAWRAKKRIFCPVTENDGKMFYRRLERDSTLKRNQFGLWEPVDGEIIAARQLDLVITPLVAFDADNNRIGMGGGYFDRYFAFQKRAPRWLRPKLIGLAFDCQKFEKIASNPWDIRLYAVVSASD